LNCKELEDLLSPYLDGELDAAQRADVERHLPGCPDCQRALKDLRVMHEALQAPALRHHASETLQQRIRLKLRDAEAREQRSMWPRWAAVAATVVVAAALTWNFLPRGNGPAAPDVDDAMVDAAVDQQQDAVKSGHLLQLSATDAKAVQAWFTGKLAYVPPVPDLSAEGFALAGARLDTVNGVPAAALVYEHGAEVVTVFVCPAQHGDKGLDTDSDDGYQVAYWTQGHLSFWIVSKLDAARVKQLGQDLRQSS
jgi:anti-sigma factor RsiW